MGNPTTSKLSHILDRFIPFPEEKEAGKLFLARRFVGAILLIILMSLIVCFLQLVVGFEEEFPVATSIAILFGILFLYKKSDSVRWAGNLTLLFFFGCILWQIFNAGGIATPHFRWMMILPMFSLLFIDLLSTLFWGFAVLLINIFVYFHLGDGHLENKEVIFNADYYLIDNTLFIATGLSLIYIYYKALELLNRELEAKNISLIAKTEEIEKQKKKLEQTQQELMVSYKDLESYAYVVSHDLKAPLRGINSFSKLLERHLINKGDLDDNTREFLGYIMGNSEHMGKLIGDILEYSRIGKDNHYEFIKTDLNVVLTKVEYGLASMIDKYDVIIEKEELPKVEILSTLMGQVFQNLISNAIKFRKKDVQLKVKIGVDDMGHEYLFHVTDNGIGIDEQFHDAIFEPFRKLHNNADYDGSGIGLATCMKILVKHRGSIWVESEEGIGTSFYFTLPKKQTLPEEENSIGSSSSINN